MATAIKDNTEKALFEIKTSLEDKNVFQRKINQNGRTKNQVKKLVNNLPTTTIHLFSEDEFQRLKVIEQNLNHNIKIKKNRKSFLQLLINFLEI